MPERPVVKVFSHNGMTVERDSLSNLVIAQTKNMYTGVMHLKTKVIYFAALAKPEHDKDDHYGTHTPKHLDAFPCRVLGETIVPIIHKDPKNPITSHEQLVQFVLGRLNNRSTAEDFCGFALRFEDGKKVALSPTSRTLNPGGNGQLEQVIMDGPGDVPERTAAPARLYAGTVSGPRHA